MQNSPGLDNLIQKVAVYTHSSDVKPILEESYQIASIAHQGFRRVNGNPYVSHPLAVAAILAEWYAPLSVITAGMLHDLQHPDYSLDCGMSQVQEKLGSNIFQLVQSMTDLNRLSWQVEKDVEWGIGVSDVQVHISSLLQQERDVLVIRMADRLHNLQEISYLAREFQERTARIAFNLLAPLADRLGILMVKDQLEDYGFEVHQPMYHKMFKEHAQKLDLQAIKTFADELQMALREIISGVSVEWQPLSLYKLYYRQMEQNTRHGRPMHTKFEALMPADAGDFLVLVDEELDCYRALGALHKRYRPVANIFRDYIGSPRVNGYRSLDTQVRHTSGTLLNVNIRTRMMHLVDKFGITARWRNVPEELLPQLPAEIKPSKSGIEILTVSGEAKQFPAGATLLDFAYSVHSELGHRCIGAVVNGEPANIYGEMRTGDRIEIIVGGLEAEPSLEWLKHARTPLAAGRIRQWFTQHKRKEMAEAGRSQLDAELQKLHIISGDPLFRQLLTQIVRKEKLQSWEDLYISIGVGRHKVSTIVSQLKSMKSLNKVSAKSAEDDALPKFLARCCRPVPPMDIVGQRRKDHVLLIHTRNCSQVKDTRDLVVVKWLEAGEANHVVVVEARNRPGLASDVSGVVSLLNYDMLRFSSSRREGGAIADSYIFLGRTTFEQREHIKRNIEKISGVTSVEVFDVSQLASPVLSPALRSVSSAVSSELARDPNPYGPSIALGPRFYGRESECRRISSLLQARSQNAAILLWGQKRIGKTSLLHRLEEHSQGNFLPVFIDMHHLSESSTIHFMHHFMQCTSQVLKDKLPELAMEVTVPRLHTFKKDPLERFEAFISIARDMSRSSSLVVILDEFQCLFNLREEEVSRDAIFSRLRSNAQHGRGMHLLLSGGGLRSYLTNDSSISSLFTIMNDEKLDCLQESDASQLIADGLGKVWTVSEDASRYLLDTTAGHPYYLQLFCSKLYEQMQERKADLTRDFVAQFVKKWLREADDSRFLHLWEAHDHKTSLRNKLILSAIANLSVDNSSVTYDQLVEAVGSIIPETQLMQSLNDLADLGLGVLRHDQLHYSIKVNLFARWLRQHWPHKLVVKECLQYE